MADGFVSSYASETINWFGIVSKAARLPPSNSIKASRLADSFDGRGVTSSSLGRPVSTTEFGEPLLTIGECEPIAASDSPQLNVESYRKQATKDGRISGASTIRALLSNKENIQ